MVQAMMVMVVVVVIMDNDSAVYREPHLHLALTEIEERSRK
jgi:hypothetical protein